MASDASDADHELQMETWKGGLSKLIIWGIFTQQKSNNFFVCCVRLKLLRAVEARTEKIQRNRHVRRSRVTKEKMFNLEIFLYRYATWHFWIVGFYIKCRCNDKDFFCKFHSALCAHWPVEHVRIISQTAGWFHRYNCDQSEGQTLSDWPIRRQDLTRH